MLKPLRHHCRILFLSLRPIEAVALLGTDVERSLVILVAVSVPDAPGMKFVLLTYLGMLSDLIASIHLLLLAVHKTLQGSRIAFLTSWVGRDHGLVLVGISILLISLCNFNLVLGVRETLSLSCL